MDVVSRLSFSRKGEESLERSQRDASLCLTSDACPPFSRGGRKQDENFRFGPLSSLHSQLSSSRIVRVLFAKMDERFFLPIRGEW